MDNNLKSLFENVRRETITHVLDIYTEDEKCMKDPSYGILALAIKLHENPDGVDMGDRFIVLDQQEKYKNIASYLNSRWISVLLDMSVLLDEALQSRIFTTTMQTELWEDPMPSWILSQRPAFLKLMTEFAV